MHVVEISVIIPAYNAEKTIRSTIESILKQTFQRFEIIVVDDGSTDSTGVILKELKETDPRILITEQKNTGINMPRVCR